MVLTNVGLFDGWTDLDSEGGVGAECLDGLIDNLEKPDHVSENSATLASIPGVYDHAGQSLCAVDYEAG